MVNNKIDSRLIKPNRMSDDEIRAILLQTGIQALRKQTGYIAPVLTECETLIFGDKPMQGFHVYVQNRYSGNYYDMVMEYRLRQFLNKECGFGQIHISYRNYWLVSFLQLRMTK